MKKSYSLFLLLLISNLAFSQTYEYAFTGDYGQIYQVSDNEFVYGIMDDSSNQFNVYTLDHLLIKSFILQQGDYSFNFLYLSKTLFNSDQKFELVYSWQNMNPYTSFGVRVINEDGNVLFEEPGYQRVSLFNTPAGAKMMLSWTWEGNLVKVYSLSGIVLETTELGSISMFNLFPNPATGHVNIAFNSPGNESGLALSVFTTIGEIVYRQKIEDGVREIQIDVSNLPVGVYLYKIHNDSFSTKTKKLIVAR
jgi:hypothetical protein